VLGRPAVTFFTRVVKKWWNRDQRAILSPGMNERQPGCQRADAAAASEAAAGRGQLYRYIVICQDVHNILWCRAGRTTRCCGWALSGSLGNGVRTGGRRRRKRMMTIKKRITSKSKSKSKSRSRTSVVGLGAGLVFVGGGFGFGEPEAGEEADYVNRGADDGGCCRELQGAGFVGHETRDISRQGCR
jgi:hypothetical protein